MGDVYHTVFLRWYGCQNQREFGYIIIIIDYKKVNYSLMFMIKLNCFNFALA